ncbi:MAG: flagellar basal body-associated FliL family protein [bacterium]|nr:flagellar basal body-associated FliL family protein [bacterium]
MGLEEEILDEDDGEELNIIAIVIAAVIVLALIGAAVWYFVLREPSADEQPQLPKWEAPEELENETISTLLPELIINPSDSKGRYFLIVKVDVSLNKPEVVQEEVINKSWRMAEIKNNIIDVFSSYRMDELRMPNYKEEARKRILNRLNELAGWTGEPPAEAEGEEALPPVKDVYFSKYILQ